MPIEGAPGSQPAGVAMADLNGDGQQDWIWVREAANGSGQQELVWSYRTGTEFGTNRSLLLERRYSRRIVIGDWDGDGRTDLLLVNGADALPVPLEMWTQNATGNFVPTPASIGGRTFTDGLLADLNRDGRPDLLLCRAGAGAVEVLLRTPQGGWQSPQVFDMPEGCDGMQVLDWNGDGIPDIVARGRVLLGRSDGAWPVAQRPAAAIAAPRPGRLSGALDAARALTGRRAP